jgi:hypothetical protein
MISPCILVTVEGLGTNLLGCYGGALSKTPNVDRFASKAIVFDQCWLQSLDIEESLRAILFGNAYRFPASGTAATDAPHTAPTEQNLLTYFSDLEVRTCFVTDAVDMPDGDFLDAFNEVALVDLDTDQQADKLEETQFARLIQFGITKLFEESDSDELGFLWIHSRGLKAKWDAPYELRTIPCDEGDPVPTHELYPPRKLLDEETDPDVLFDAICGASAQAAAFDFAWLYLNELIEEKIASVRNPEIMIDPTIVMMGLNGYPLGEHEAIGDIDDHLFAERLHVPLIIRPCSLDIGARQPHIIQPWQIGALIQECLVAQSSDQVDEDAFWRQPPELSSFWKNGNRLAWAASENQYALITPAWTSRVIVASVSSENPNRADLSVDAITPMALWQVFVNPDDRYQQNNVTDRVEPVVKRLSEIATRLRDAIYGTEGRIDVKELQILLESLLTEDLVRLVK